MTAAYLLRSHDFLLLEKEPHWGGNAYLMEYQGTAYATGSAFLGKSEYAYSFAKEIGLEPLPVHDRDSTIIKGEWIGNTWTDGLDRLPYPAAVREGLSAKGLRVTSLVLGVEPKQMVAPTAEQTRAVVDFLDALEEHEDVKEVYSNAEFPE